MLREGLIVQVANSANRVHNVLHTKQKESGLRIFLLILAFSFVSFGQLQYKNLPKRGSGKYTFLFMDIYTATLWAEKDKPIYSTPLRLELLYKRDFDGEDIASRSVKEMEQAGVSKGVLKEFKSEMFKVFPDVKKGDRIIADFDPKTGVTFYLNSKKRLGQFKDLEFSKHFLNIWLGEKTSDPKLRSKLLGE